MVRILLVAAFGDSDEFDRHQMRALVEKLKNRVLGVGASDARLVRLLAALLGHPVERCADDETGARGAALYAAMSQDLDDAGPASPLRAPCELIEPDARDAR